MKLYRNLALCLSLLASSTSLWASDEVKSEAKPELPLRYDIFELAFVPMDFTWSRTKDDDGDLYAQRELKTVPKSLQASYFTKKYGFSFAFYDSAKVLGGTPADGKVTISEVPGRFDFYWGLNETMYVDIGLDINRSYNKRADDSETDRNLILRGGVYYRKVTSESMLKGGAYVDWMLGGNDTDQPKKYNSLGLGFKGDYYFMAFSDKFYLGTGLNVRLSLVEKVELRDLPDYKKSGLPLDLNWRVLEFNVVI